MRFSEIDADVVARRAAIARDLAAIIGDTHVIADGPRLRAYDTDALTAYRTQPLCTVLPGSADEVCAVLKYCAAHGLKIVPRGAGTSLSGGAHPLADGVLLGLSRMNRILEVDAANRCAVVEPGVPNLAISRAAEPHGLFYAPDPSSQVACTIGGNVAENAGGAHCLKYGLTTNNLLGLELALADGERIRLGGRFPDAAGYDLMGLVTGSEGLLGIVTQVTVRLTPKPQAVQVILAAFGEVEAAGAAVAAIMAAGIVPAALEFMDRQCLIAVEAHSAPGYPTDAACVLLIELDGVASEIAHEAAIVRAIAADHDALRIEDGADEAACARLWAGRKAAFGAMGRLAPDMLCMDGTIPRRRLPEMLRAMAQMAGDFGLGFANVFHAGDGNLHPLILFDAMKPGELERAEAFGAAILKRCVELGGVLSGEHGVGIEKRDLMDLQFTDEELARQEAVKCAFDPSGRLNPGKVFPSLSACIEGGHMHVHQGRLPFAHLPRF